MFLLLAVATLVIGGGFAEISANGAPTSLETSVVRLIIAGSPGAAGVRDIIGGHRLAHGRG